MKKLTTSIFAILISTAANASDMQQVTTSEVFTKTEVRQQYVSPQPRMKPIHVYTGSTVIVKDHYDVYQPRIVYDKVGSYYTTSCYDYSCK